MANISIREVFDEAIKTSEGKERLKSHIAGRLAESKEYREGVAELIVECWTILSRH